MRKFEKVIIVSGGKSNFYTDNLDEVIGLGQVMRLIPTLEKSIDNDFRVIMLSSALSYNKRTAEEILRKLPAINSMEIEPSFGNSKKSIKRDSFQAAKVLFSEAALARATAVIVVVEKEYVNQLSKHIFENNEAEIIPEFDKMNDGEIIILDLAHNTREKVWSNVS